MNQQTNTTFSPQDFSEVAEYLQSELKRHDRLRRVCDALTRIGSLSNAEKEIEASRAEAARRLAELQSVVEAAEHRVEQARREAEKLVAEAYEKAAWIAAQARSNAEAEQAKLDAALQAKRDELAAVGARLNRARELLG